MSESKPFLLDISGSTRIGNTNAVEFDISLGLRVNGANKYVCATLQAKNEEGISLPALIEALDGGKQAALPEFLQNLPAIQRFSIQYGSAENTNEFDIEFDSLLKINGKNIEATIVAGYNKARGQLGAFTFGATLRTGSHRFSAVFAKVGADWYLYALYKSKGAVTVNLKDITGAFFDDADAIPDASLTLDAFKAFLLYRKKKDGSTALMAGLGAGLSLAVTDLPLVGELLNEKDAFAFKEVLALYTNGNFTAGELKQFDGLPAVAVSAGFNISAQLMIDGEEDYYVLNGGMGKKSVPEKKTTGEEANKRPVVNTLAGEVASKAKWMKVDKKIGPVTIKRLGFLYNAGKVLVLLDASVLMAGMGMQLAGLGLGFKLEWKFPPAMPEFYIDGIGLSYTRDPLRISGMFIRATPQDGVEQYAYYGAAQLSLAGFSVSGMGAYSRLVKPEPDGSISMFIYAMYAGAIGGPAFFFVTGIAAGFGFNRKVKVPSIREVNTFPLVAMAMNPDPDKSLNNILGDLVSQQWVPASPGDYWLAAGIRFTSFNIIDSFLLMLVQFGTRTEFALLGLSVLAWPSKKITIAYVELAVKASFGSDSEVIAVEAMLTPNSYLLDKKCKLTGGFAFYAWIKGEHEGDFVITLGGYHPRFSRPSHYPEVDRLGLNWKISDEVEIKGGLYYALTPGSIMAGGRLEVTFSLSFLKASVVAWVDLYIAWAPFEYAAEIGIRVKIEANIKVMAISVHFKLEMGAVLYIWGPSFAGEAHVNWNIFSFTIPLGNARKEEKKKLSWSAFREQFIPVNAVNQVTPEIIVSAGIINEYTVDANGTKQKYLLVNPHQLKINVDAPMPVTTVQLPDGAGGFTEMQKDAVMQTGNGPSLYGRRNQKLGIRPMQQTTLTSTLKVEVLRNGQQPGGAFTPEYSSYASGVPESLWSSEQAKGDNSKPDEVHVLKNALKGVAIAAREAPVPEKAQQFDLNGRFVVVDKLLSWAYTPALTGPDNTAYSVPLKTIVTNALKNDATTAARQAIIKAALQVQGVSDAAEAGDVYKWVDALGAEPVIVQLGGLPQYKNETAKKGKADNGH